MILLNQKVLTWIISAINGSKVMKEIRLSKSLNSEEIKSVTSVLKNEYLGMGSDVGKFENEIKILLEQKMMLFVFHQEQQHFIWHYRHVILVRMLRFYILQ